MRSGGSPAWRNSNPGNLRAASTAVGSANGFAVFSNDADGLEAMYTLLASPRYQRLTLWELVNRYAPPSENDTQAYLRAIARSTGLHKDARVADLSESSMQALVNAMRQHEGWIPGVTTVRRGNR